MPFGLETDRKISLDRCRSTPLGGGGGKGAKGRGRSKQGVGVCALSSGNGVLPRRDQAPHATKKKKEACGAKRPTLCRDGRACSKKSKVSRCVTLAWEKKGDGGGVGSPPPNTLSATSKKEKRLETSLRRATNVLKQGFQASNKSWASRTGTRHRGPKGGFCVSGGSR